MRPITAAIGFDDAPFATNHRGDVRVVGVVCARTRVDGVVSTAVRRDGVNSTDKMIEVVRSGPFDAAIRVVILQGIAVAGFNVVDITRLADQLERPVIVVARRMPNYPRIKRALESVPGGARKWRLIERLGPPDEIAVRSSRDKRPIESLNKDRLFVQRAGIGLPEATATVRATTLVGNVPEPLRLAHLIAGGVTTGFSRGGT